MNNKSIYSSIILAKSGVEIPLLVNGKTLDSKYNPERDCKRIVDEIELKEYFFIVIGIGSGILIKELSSKFPNSKILIFEKSKEDIDFLLTLKLVKQLSLNKNIIFCDLESLETAIINNYLPVIDGELKIIEQRPWIQENSEIIEIINSKINKSIGIVSADYSVQSHFGKIWQSNIMNNLKLLNNIKQKTYGLVDKNKKALIVGAGPSVDNKIKSLIKNRDDYCIISTDTSYSTLMSYNIIPDYAISIDGQFVSHNHFMKTNNKTIFLLDLCSDHTTSAYLAKHNCNISFFISGHPLSTFAATTGNLNFLKLFSGAGTVTITAVDFALETGFEEIEIIGADFAYHNGKSYSKGTYFDKLYSLDSTKLSSLEKNYDNLMYRTELEKQGRNEYTTNILNSYKLSMEAYLLNKNCIINKKDYTYYIKNNNCNQNIINLNLENFNYKTFLSKLQNSTADNLLVPLLPYMAWLKNNNNYKNYDFNTILKLAQSHIVSYN